MKKLLLAAIVLLCATAITVQAQDSGGKKAKKELTTEQKKTPEDLNLFLQNLKATLPVDDRRIYLSGIKHGGLWHLGQGRA